MFKTHQKKIGAYAQSSPEAMFEVVTFTLLTIQQSIQDMPAQMKDVRRVGSESRFLWGFKEAAYDWHYENMSRTYDVVMNTYYGLSCPKAQEVETLRIWAHSPGLGIVKGGFMNQLVFGITGCMDSHNNKVFEIPKDRFHANKIKRAKRPKTKAKILESYVDLCLDQGGAEFLWDNWCKLVAEANKSTAHKISKLHTDAIGV